jgi:peptidyl-prolyl cis-trans isomerase B (cyclophilin B)
MSPSVPSKRNLRLSGSRRVAAILLLPLLLTLGGCLLAPSASASEAIIRFAINTFEKDDQVVKITLFDHDAPVAVANFKALVAKKFYNGLAVHRIVPETLIQFGDPLSRKADRSLAGTGGPGYTLPAEIHRPHIRGSVAMAALPPALNPSRASNGSQIYIVLRAQPELDKDYTVFGQVTVGLDFLDSLSRRARDTNDYPLERVNVRSIEIH